MKKIVCSVIALFVAQQAFAVKNLELQGTTPYSITKSTSRAQPASSKALQSAPKNTTKTIRLLNIKLSEAAWQKLNNDNASSTTKNTYSLQSNTLPSHLQVGMNQLPVLDQGPYGSCVTFAVSAAVNAAISNTDMISQLCQLELGQYLNHASGNRVPSGWDGSLGALVLNQIELYGYITKDTEKTGACGGLTAYPTSGEVPAAEMSIQDFTLLSHDLSEFGTSVSWSSLIDYWQATSNEINPDDLLNTIKKTLNEGDRLTFGVLLFLPQMGVAGAVGQHSDTTDSWVVTPLIDKAIKLHGPFGAHAMIITGYDDNATAIDDKGRIHTGLLTLRNSWGSDVGDQGTFYMSYEYFKRLAIEVQRVRSL